MKKLTKLTISTLNIFGMSLNFINLRTRCLTIAEFLNNSNKDVINFQEVFSYFYLKILKKQLSNYPFCIYKKSLFGPKGGLVIFSKYPLTNLGYASFPCKNIPLFSIPEFIFQKGILLAEQKEIGVILMNTHFTAVLDHNYSRKGKYYQFKQTEIITLKSIIANKYNRNKNIIICGDFNIKKNSDMYFDLLKIEKLYDPFSNFKGGTRHQAFISGNRKPNWIDYILIIGDVKDKVTDMEILFPDKVRLVNKEFGYISDHLGLQITYNFAWKIIS